MHQLADQLQTDEIARSATEEQFRQDAGVDGYTDERGTKRGERSFDSRVLAVTRRRRRRRRLYAHVCTPALLLSEILEILAYRVRFHRGYRR